MPLKTLVKVGSITNLSDARYCAGMGVDLLGFRVVETDGNYVSPALFQQLRGWITGPKIVAEAYGISNLTNLGAILENYAPDYIECTPSELPLIRSQSNIPVILRVSDSFALTDSNIAYYLTGVNPSINLKPLIIQITSKEEFAMLSQVGNYEGVALEGSPEVRPGFKNYEHLSEVLELLEEE
jgi:phosphoribosylanthranilate isomerase